MADSTKTTYRGILERFRVGHGDKGVAHLKKGHVQVIITGMTDTPAAAANLLRMIHLLMRHAIDLGWRGDDPTPGVRKPKRKVGGFLTWEEDHIATFTTKHLPGSWAHLALTLLLCTGQRRSDVVRMGRQYVRKDVLAITQQKTGQNVYIPLHPDLKALLDRLPLTNLTFLMTAHGKPFVAAGFTNWFHDMVKEAGLPAGLSPHGLSKATCRRLAEAGCSAHEIMAISGHRSLAEVTRYTVAARRKDLAARAMLALGRSDDETATVKPAEAV